MYIYIYARTLEKKIVFPAMFRGFFTKAKYTAQILGRRTPTLFFNTISNCKYTHPHSQPAALKFRNFVAPDGGPCVKVKTESSIVQTL